MTNLLKFSLRRSSVVLLGLAFIFLLRPAHAHADCSSTMLDEDPYIEITTCITSDSDESDAYANATSSEAEDIWLQVQFMTGEGEVDSQVGCGYESATASASVPLSVGYDGAYTVYAGDGPDWEDGPAPMGGWGGTCGGYCMNGDSGPFVE
jgi:hypothetical protein